MDTPTFIEAFNLAFELVVKWVFLCALSWLFAGFVVFLVWAWKAIYGGAQHLHYGRGW